MSLRGLLIAAGFAIGSITVHAADLSPLHADCAIGPSENPGHFRLEIDKGDCFGNHGCHNNFSNDTLSQFNGMTVEDLNREGARLTATLNAEAGTFTCSGTVRQGELEGTSVFRPNMAFAGKMDRMGYTGLDSEKLMAYAFIGVESEWVESMRRTGVRGMTTDNLLALRIFKIDPEYVHSFTAMGYVMPDADKLIALKVQGVNAEEVRQIRELGYQPTVDELIQIRIFRITPEFIRRMQDRGLKNLTIAKLVQIRIFKLDD